MSSISETVNRKFTHIFDASEWEIETDTGWESLIDVRQTVEYDKWILELEDGKSLECADDHIVFTEDFEEIFVKNLYIGDKIQTKDGPVKVSRIQNTSKKEHMYDLSVDSENHRLYTNDILSHNTASVSAFAIHHALFQDRKNVLILANKYETAKDILDRIKKIYEELPWWLQQGVLAWNKGSLELENYSKITVGTTTENSGRSGSISLLILDEFAFVRHSIADSFWQAVYPVISSGKESKVIIISTANGLNLFYKLWHDALEKKNEFEAFEVHWSDVPGRDRHWKKQTIANLGDESKFLAEYENEFLGSSNTLIPMYVLKRLRFVDPIQKDTTYSVYEKAKSNRSYIATVDVARGIGGDYSVINVTDITEYPYKQVAVYRNNSIEAMLFANIVHQWALNYNNAYILIEGNDLGEMVSGIIHNDLEYENLILTSHGGRSGQRLGGGFGKTVRTGLMMSNRVKNIGCSNLKALLVNDQYIVRDFYTIQELSSFVQKGRSFAGEEGTHDDVVMTLVILSWAVQDPYWKDLTDQDLRVKLEESRMEELMETATPFGFISDGLTEDEEAGWVNVENLSTMTF